MVGVSFAEVCSLLTCCFMTKVNTRNHDSVTWETRTAIVKYVIGWKMLCLTVWNTTSCLRGREKCFVLLYGTRLHVYGEEKNVLSYCMEHDFMPTGKRKMFCLTVWNTTSCLRGREKCFVLLYGTRLHAYGEEKNALSYCMEHDFMPTGKRKRHSLCDFLLWCDITISCNWLCRKSDAVYLLVQGTSKYLGWSKTRFLSNIRIL